MLLEQENSSLDAIIDGLAHRLVDSFDGIKKQDSSYDNLRELLNVPSQQQPIKVLDVACGESGLVVLKALDIYFGEGNFNYLGIDINLSQINELQQALSKKNRTDARFECLDATDPKNLTSIAPGSIDLVILRHPDPVNRSNIFNKIMHDFIPMFIKPGGVFFSTTYHEVEMGLCFNTEAFRKIYRADKFPVFRPITRHVPSFSPDGLDDQLVVDAFAAFGKVNLPLNVVRQQRALHQANQQGTNSRKQEVDPVQIQKDDAGKYQGNNKDVVDTNSTSQLHLDLFKKYKLTYDREISTVETAFRRAAAMGNCHDVKFFLDNFKMDIDSQDNLRHKKTALHWAVKNRHSACIKLLLNRGAKKDISDVDDKTAEYYAEQSQDPTIFSFFNPSPSTQKLKSGFLNKRAP